MEVLAVPVSTNMVTSTFGSIYSTVVATTGSTLLGYVIVTLVVFGIGFLLWTVGNWLYNLFTAEEPPVKEIKYYDALGNLLEVTNK